MNSGLLALPADSPAGLLPLPISQHLPDSPSRPRGGGKVQSLNLRDTDVAMGYKCCLVGLRREEHQLLGCQEALLPQDDVSQFSSSAHASGLAVTLARPDVVSSRGPGEREDVSLEARRPGCP